MMQDVKTVAISGRIAADDYEFLMNYPIPGKVTISDKLRYATAFFRLKHEGVADYADCHEAIMQDLSVFARSLKNLELKQQKDSELVAKVISFSVETLAYLMTVDLQEECGEKDLLQVELTLFNKVVALLESVLRMGITSESPTYNKKLFHKKLEQVKQLIKIIES